jgi:O-antigen/teichoic acid export membrane protein
MLVGFAFLYVLTGQQLTSTVLLVGSAIVLSLVLLLQWCLLGRELPSQIKTVKPELKTREWLRFSLSALTVTGVFVVLQETSMLVIGIWLAPEQVGLYSAAAKTIQLMNMPSMAMGALSVPMFSSLHAREDRHGLQEMLFKTVSWSFCLSVIGAVILVSQSGFFLGLFGPEFIAAQPALIILVIGGLVTAGGGPLRALMQVTGHQRQTAFVIGYSALAGIVLSIIGVYLFGITGAAAATAITTALWVTRLNMLSIKTLGVHSSIFYALGKRRAAKGPLS